MLNFLNKELKAYDELVDRIKNLPSTWKKIVFIVVAFLMISLFFLFKVGDIGQFCQDYNNALVEFDGHLEQVTRTENGIKELESALNTLNKIKKIESKKIVCIIVCIRDKKAMQLTEDFERKCDELKKHFNEMRFSDDEFVKRDGEQLYNAVENIRRKL